MIYLICPQLRKPVECKARRHDVAVLRHGVVTRQATGLRNCPEGSSEKGRIAALRRLLRGATLSKRRALHCIPFRSNVHIK